MVAGWAVGVGSHGRNVAQAAKFVDYLTGKQADPTWIQKAGQLPMTPEGKAASSAYLAQPANQHLSVAAEGVAKYGWLVPTDIAAAGFRQALNRAAQAVLTNGAAPEAALKAAEQSFIRANHVK